MKHIIIAFVLLLALSSCKYLESIEDKEYNRIYYTEYNTANNTVWIGHASYIECGEVYFTDLQSAVESLKYYNIKVLFSKRISYTTNCVVICGSSSSLIFGAQIHIIDLGKAQNLGWYIVYN